MITIGAHTVGHGQLSALSPEEQRLEICGSKEALEENLGRPVTSSYPFGIRERDFTDELHPHHPGTINALGG